MPQPLRSRPAAEPRFARSLAIGADLDDPPQPMPGDVPVRTLLNDPAKSAVPSRSGLIVESVPELALHRLRIVLASLRPGAGETASVAHDAPVGAMDRAADPVIAGLSDALAAAERAGDPHFGIYADAVRLAIAIRLLGQQPGHALRGDERAEPPPAARQMHALQKWRLKRVLAYIDDHLPSKISLGDLAAVAGLSRMHFASQFRAATGLRPHEYLLRRRIRRAQELMLLGPATTIVDIALTVGFQTQAHFTTVFKRFVGHTPFQWRSARRGDSPACS